jgi:hypothetical protein
LGIRSHALEQVPGLRDSSGDLCLRFGREGVGACDEHAEHERLDPEPKIAQAKRLHIESS